MNLSVIPEDKAKGGKNGVRPRFNFAFQIWDVYDWNYWHTVMPLHSEKDPGTQSASEGVMKYSRYNIAVILTKLVIKNIQEYLLCTFLVAKKEN